MNHVVFHAHFYQPPREDPWLDEIERDPEATPYHDWTARVAQECYRGVVAARVLDGEGRIRRLVNTLAYASFDVGPSLLAWLERRMPNVYAAVLEADRASIVRLGYGNAIAHPYDHVVLPLCSRRDKVTEVRWGIADFRRRFGRDPLGMWLPEMAVDDETLDVVAEQGIRFTMLAPEQLTGAPATGAAARYVTTHGRELTIVPHDPTLSSGVAFGGLLRDGKKLAEEIAAQGGDDAGDRLIAIVADGETYGHHHQFGDMALAAAIDVLERHPRATLANVASYLGTHPATGTTGIAAPSAWSCAHGVERWRGDCTCGVVGGMSHRWRPPLREAIDGLVADAHALFEREAAPLLGDPWAARDAYETEAGPAYPPALAHDPPLPSAEVRARELLEMERQVLRAQTSSAWFFDDVARPEALVVLRAAARAIELAGDAGHEMEGRLLDRLGAAASNDAAQGTARDLYVRRARPPQRPAMRVAAGYAAVRRFGLRGDVELPDAWSAAADGHIVLLVERRTGHRWEFDVLVDVPGSPVAPHAARSETSPSGFPAITDDAHPERGAPIRLADVDPRAITILVRPLHRGAPESAPLGTALKLPALPTRTRRAVEKVVRRAVVHRLLDDDERARLAAGEKELGAIVHSALRRAVRHLADDSSPQSVARVLGLIDLHDALRELPAFDAQTTFHAVRAAAAPDVAVRLAPIARRLGFTPRAWE